MLERVAGMLDYVCRTFFVRNDRNQNILLTKNVSRTSYNMPAAHVTLYNIVRTCSRGLYLVSNCAHTVGGSS